MGDGGESGDKDGGNGAGAGYAVQGSRAVSVIIWKKELGGDRGNSKTTRGIPSSGIKRDYEDDGAAYGNQRVGLSPVAEALKTAGI